MAGRHPDRNRKVAIKSSYDRWDGMFARESSGFRLLVIAVIDNITIYTINTVVLLLLFDVS